MMRVSDHVIVNKFGHRREGPLSSPKALRPGCPGLTPNHKAIFNPDFSLI